MEMEKQRLLDMDVESLQLICVNPYEVNPVTQQNTVSHQLSTKIESKDVPSTSQQNCSAINGGEFYTPQEKKIKLEMEEFGDLSRYLHSKPKSRNSVDELNTPIFDKNLPGYDLNFDYSQSDQHFVKLERELCDNISNCIFKNNSIHTKKTNNNEYMTSEFDNNIQLQNSIKWVISPGSDKGSVYDHLSPQSYNISGISYSIDHQSAPSINSNNDIISNASSPATDNQHIHSSMTSPASSICSSKCPTPKLSLNVDLRPLQKIDLATPNIIEGVVELETGSFNILDYLQNEAVPCETINVEDLIVSSEERGVISGNDIGMGKSQLHTVTAKKRPRKRRLPEDDDEDYVPPNERIFSKKRILVGDSSDSDSENEVEVQTKPRGKVRGRPPKRRGSVSSNCSKDSDASKYRELRDKNNEASRRSRLKRKLKEQELEDEADELYSRNIKLKAEVEELEKLVTKFREDLFKIMIRK